MKRLLDVLVALVALLLLLPLLLVIGCCVVIDTGLPFFFVQERIGLGGRPFRLVKFRTMSVRQGAEKGSFDIGNSSRVTKVGKFLRRTKLDELPQFWNVLWGEMSLVGPRPEVKQWTLIYPEMWKVVHSVRPGLTDEASIRFRHEEILLQRASNPELAYRNEILPEKLRLNAQYVNRQSTLYDGYILWRTLLILLKFNK